MSRVWEAIVDGQNRIKVYDHEVDKMTVVKYYSHLHSSVEKVRPIISGDYKAHLHYSILGEEA